MPLTRAPAAKASRAAVSQAASTHAGPRGLDCGRLARCRAAAHDGARWVCVSFAVRHRVSEYTIGTVIGLLREPTKSTCARRPRFRRAESLSGDLHGADVVLCVFNSGLATNARYQMLLEYCRVRSGQRIHDVGFGDHVQLGGAAIAISEHASYYGDNGTDINGTGGIARPVLRCACGPTAVPAVPSM